MKKPNIIFIVMDALRARNLHCYGYSRRTSQNIDNLAKEGILFQNAFSTNNSTDNSFLSILSGRHVLKTETIFSTNIQENLFYTPNELQNFLDAGGKFIQEILKENQYKTYCLKYIHGWQKRGFDYYFDEKSWKASKTKWNFIDFLRKNELVFRFLKKLFYYSSSNKLTCYLASRKIKNKIKSPSNERSTNEAIKIIKENKNNSFFMWIDYADTHMPYNPNKFSDKFNAKGIVEDIIAKYDSAIFYNDYLIGKIINALKKQKIYDNTLIFFFSDHGESLGEHQIYFDHHGLYDVSVHVPLIIKARKFKNKSINGLIQLEDITPTALELAGIKYDSSLFDGKSLVPLMKGDLYEIRESILLEECYLSKKMALRTKNYKYILANSKKEAKCIKCNKVHGGLVELYDLKKDPPEKMNLARDKKDILVEMHLKLQREIKRIKVKNEKRRLNNLLSKL